MQPTGNVEYATDLESTVHLCSTLLRVVRTRLGQIDQNDPEYRNRRATMGLIRQGVEYAIDDLNDVIHSLEGGGEEE